MLVLAGLGVAGCTGDPQDRGTPDADQPTSTGPAPDFHDAEPSSTLTLGWGPEDQRSARRTARTAMRLFARPTLDADQWWADLAPLLSTAAQRDYAGVDPAEVPVHTITGPVSLVDLGSTQAAIVHVPTDAGLYAVSLSRTGTAPGWVVEAITPPEPYGD